MASTSHDLSLPALVRFLSDVGRSRLLVVGDAIVDEYVDGVVDRISPEAPVPVLRVTSRHSLSGGAAHVARIAAALGARVDLVAAVGDDEDGRLLRSACDGSGIGTDGVVVVADRPTTRKTRIVSGPQQIVRLDDERTDPLRPTDHDRVLRSLERSERVDAVVVSDYAKGLLDESVLAAVFELARRWNACVLVDPKHRDLSRYCGADIVKLNRDELATAVGRTVPDEDLDAIGACAKEVRDATGATAVVVTLGPSGMAIFSGDDPPRLIPATGQSVFDVTGAGDVVAALVALGRANGLPLSTAAGYANLAAGIAVRQRGTRVVQPSQLLQELIPSPAIRLSARSPVQRSELMALAEAWRRSGERIVFTNGCFDLFHRGHLELLRRAAAFGDRLVVAVDTDESVRRLKGSGRPVIPQSDRAEILGALPFVDTVVLFDDALEDLIIGIRPAVLVKGADYTDRHVVGQDAVEADGGRVELVEMLEHRSTTEIVGRLVPTAPNTGMQL